MAEENPQAPKPILSELSDEEVLRRVKGLIALGNSPKVTELILLQAGALPEQVRDALQKTQQQKQAEIKEQNYLGWVIVLVVIIMVLLGIYVWLNRPRGNQPAQESAQADTSDPLITTLLQSFFESQNIPPVNDLPEPFVEFDESGNDAACPTTSQSAVAIFGGSSGTWDYQAETNGWLFYNNAPSQINLPNNMAGTVAYGSGRSPKFLPVIGPARVSNAYMAFILCP